MFGDKYLRITDKCSIFVDELHEMQDYNSEPTLKRSIF